jgi:ankyrin repeat protein
MPSDTLLNELVAKNDLTGVKSFCQFSIIPNDLCHVAAANDSLDVLRWLVEIKGLNVTKKNSEGSTPLLVAAQNGSMRVLRYFLSLNCAETLLQERDNHHRTALMHAARKGNLQAVKDIVLKDKVTVNWCDSFNRSALIHAAKFGFT